MDQELLGNNKEGSDIDLAIMNEGVDDLTIARIKEDFSESSLAYRIDLIDYTRIKHEELIDHINRVGKLFYRAEREEV